MELTAKAIEEAEFRQTFRGYDVDQVDDFLEEVAAGVSALMKQLDEAKVPSPASRAPVPAAQPAPAAQAAPVVQPVAESKTIEDNTDELRRTLILAQRTADAAIREAKEEAARLVSEARDTSTRQIADADARAKKLVADAEEKAATIIAEAERMADEHRSSSHDRLRSEIEALEGTREELRSDAEVIDSHVEQQRQQLRGSLAQLQRLIDDPKGFRLNPPPPVRPIETPQFESPATIGPAPTAGSVAGGDAPAEPAESATATADESAAEPATAAEPPTPSGPESASAADATADAGANAPIEISLPEPPPPADVPDSWTSLRNESAEPVVDLTAPTEGSPPPGEPGGGSDPGATTEEPAATAAGTNGDASAAEPDAEATAPSDTETDAAEGDPTQAVPQLVGDADEDAFLAELRKAMTDDEPLGPRDESDLATRSSRDSPAQELPRQRPRFGRRR